MKFEEIKDVIESKKNLAEVDIEEIAKEDGIADSLAKQFEKQIKSTQLRKFFDRAKGNLSELKDEGKDWDYVKNDFYMLRPVLAYSQARKHIPKQFFELMDLCMKKVESDNRKQLLNNYTRFIQLLESLVAYHRYYREFKGSS